MKFKVLMLFAVLLLSGCFPYMYYDQKEVLIENVNIDETLRIAEKVLEKGGLESILAIWVIRDQVITPLQAKKISEYYFKYIDIVGAAKDRTVAEFDTWHFAWAISNYYRNGNSEVKIELENAYQDAKKRPGTLKKFKDIADEHVNGEKIYMGDIHSLGRNYAYSHIVVPGNKKYVQSFDEYMMKSAKNKEKKQ